MPSQKPSYPQRFWLAALVVAWSVDFLFWNKPLGISYPIFITVLLLAGFGLLYSEKARPALSAVILAGMIFILAWIPFARSAPLPRVTAALLVFSALALLALTLRSGGWQHFRLLDYITGGFELLLAAVARAAGLRLLPAGEGKGRAFWRPLLPVLRGLALALPLLIIMSLLLSSADLVFADQMQSFLRVFDIDRLPEMLFRLVYILILAYIFAGLLAFAVLPNLFVARKIQALGKPEPDTSRELTISDGDISSANIIDSNLPKSVISDPVATGVDASETDVAGTVEAGQPQPKHRGFLGATEAFIVLGSLNLLFAFFVGLQFRYFFGGQANITAAGYTYADYARRGFFELVAVAAITLLVVVILDSLTRLETQSRRRVFSALTALLVGLVLVMLVSAFQRLLLYEDAYGFTRLRSYTHLFIPWLGFLLVATIVLQFTRRQQVFNGLLLLTAFGFTLMLGLINVDAWIVRQNVARTASGAELDGAYLLTLSEDAIPALADAYRRAEQPAVRDTLGSVLACAAQGAQQAEARPWQSFHLGQTRAVTTLAALDLSAYPVRVESGAPYVSLPTGQFDCYMSYFMD